MTIYFAKKEIPCYECKNPILAGEPYRIATNDGTKFKHLDCKEAKVHG
jgi:hypothetical protein